MSFIDDFPIAPAGSAFAPKAPARTIRLVAIDLDGTLLDDAKQVSPGTTAALPLLARRGIKVIIASARPPRSVRHIYQRLQLDTWQINYNGALIWDEPGQAVIFHQPMSAELTRAIIDRARALFPAVLVSCEILDRWYTDKFDPAFSTATSKLFEPDVVAPIEQWMTTPITKLLLLGPPEMMTELQPILSREFAGQVGIVRTDDDLIQIMENRVGKAEALQMTAHHYGIAPDEILAIGDAPNDVGMLRLAGVAVAMDNAHELVKRAAHWVAPSNNDHGVYAALVKYGLI